MHFAVGNTNPSWRACPAAQEASDKVFCVSSVRKRHPLALPSRAYPAPSQFDDRNPEQVLASRYGVAPCNIEIRIFGLLAKSDIPFVHPLTCGGVCDSHAELGQSEF